MSAVEANSESRRSPLHAVLAPASVAVVGASADPAKRGYRAIMGLLQGAYPGAIYPIHPKIERILGLKTYPTLEATPGPVDLALICTPAASVPALVTECGHKGVKGAAILASGFGETGPEGAKLEQALLAAARAGGVRVIGPNTSGLFNLHHQLDPLGLASAKPGGVGLISQSGNLLLALVLEAAHDGAIGFSTYVGPGNQADIDFSDYLRYLGEDENTRVAALYVEGFRDGRRFLQTARAITPLKPVVVYKSGSTEPGRRAARSHTGALAGSHALAADLLRQVGVSVVDRSDEILAVANGLGLLQKARGKRVGVVADGGGQATIASDRLSEAGLELAELTERTRARLRAILLPQAALANPVDVAGSTDADPALLATCLEIVAADPNVDAVFLVGMFGGYSLRFADHLLDGELRGAAAMIEIARRADKPLVVHSLYAPAKPPALVRLREGGLPVYASIEQAVRVLAALGERGAYLGHNAGQPPPTELTPRPEMRRLFARARRENRDLFEFEARRLLRGHGVRSAPERVARRVEELAEAAAPFGTQALALKVVSKDILHKSDAGGVKLNVRGVAALREAWETMMASCRAYAPHAAIKGALVTPMAQPGIDAVIGATRDPVFGPVLMFGLGGVWVETLKDVAFRAIPLSRHAAESMLTQIKGAALLNGARGQPAVDQAALVDLLLQTAGIVAAYPELSELDLNPVRLYPDGYAVLDARLIIDRSAPGPQDLAS